MLGVPIEDNPSDRCRSDLWEFCERFDTIGARGGGCLLSRGRNREPISAMPSTKSDRKKTATEDRRVGQGQDGPADTKPDRKKAATVNGQGETFSLVPRAASLLKHMTD